MTKKIEMDELVSLTGSIINELKQLRGKTNILDPIITSLQSRIDDRFKKLRYLEYGATGATSANIIMTWEGESYDKERLIQEYEIIMLDILREAKSKLDHLEVKIEDAHFKLTQSLAEKGAA